MKVKSLDFGLYLFKSHSQLQLYDLAFLEVCDSKSQS